MHVGQRVIYKGHKESRKGQEAILVYRDPDDQDQFALCFVEDASYHYHESSTQGEWGGRVFTWVATHWLEEVT